MPNDIRASAGIWTPYLVVHSPGTLTTRPKDQKLWYRHCNHCYSHLCRSGLEARARNLLSRFHQVHQVLHERSGGSYCHAVLWFRHQRLDWTCASMIINMYIYIRFFKNEAKILESSLLHYDQFKLILSNSEFEITN